MRNIYEIVMKAKEVNKINDEPNGITRITVRVEGYDRNSAILLAEASYTDYSVYYVMAGPRLNVEE